MQHTTRKRVHHHHHHRTPTQSPPAMRTLKLYMHAHDKSAINNITECSKYAINKPTNNRCAKKPHLVPPKNAPARQACHKSRARLLLISSSIRAPGHGARSYAATKAPNNTHCKRTSHKRDDESSARNLSQSAACSELVWPSAQRKPNTTKELRRRHIKPEAPCTDTSHGRTPGH